MKLILFLFSLFTIQAVFGEAIDKFKATLKTEEQTLKCSFVIKLSGSEVSSANVKCSPKKHKKAKFTNMKIQGKLAEYLISFSLKPTRIMKISIVPACGLGFTQVCTPTKGACRYGMEEYCPGGEESQARGSMSKDEECTCLASITVETARHADVHPLGSCYDECVCLQNTCDAEYHWGYEGPAGPEHWGEQFPACDGLKQSPIDIVSVGAVNQAEPSPMSFGNYDQIRMVQLGNTGEHYPGATRLVDGSIKNNGHTAQLDVVATLPGDVGVLSGGPLASDYQILQLHFHWGADDTQGSEHTLDGVSYPMEMHIVHKKVGEENFLEVEGGLAVTGFFFEIDTVDNVAIDPLVDALANIMNPDDKFDMSGSTFKITDLIADAAPLSPGDQAVYSSYSGSLTTPGCMEIVNWINFIKPIKISAGQLAKFRMLKDGDDMDVVDNFRPTQPLNGRTVTFYEV